MRICEHWCIILFCLLLLGQIRLQTLSDSSVKKLTQQQRHNLEVVVTKMGVDTEKELSAMLKHTPGAKPPPVKYFYPKPPLHAMGMLNFEVNFTHTTEDILIKIVFSSFSRM